jgi:hypothetical protein
VRVACGEHPIAHRERSGLVAERADEPRQHAGAALGNAVVHVYGAAVDRREAQQFSGSVGAGGQADGAVRERRGQSQRRQRFELDGKHDDENPSFRKGAGHEGASAEKLRARSAKRRMLKRRRRAREGAGDADRGSG